MPEYANSELLANSQVHFKKFSAGSSRERVKGQLVDLQAVRLVHRIVIELCTIASIEIVALKTKATATCMSSIPLYSKH